MKKSGESASIIHEPARDLPVCGKYDVVVVGGGIAGVAAAVAAARNSASVCLVERTCGLGGLATLGNVIIWLPICDGNGRQVIAGMGEELLRLSVADLRLNNDSARFLKVPSCWEPGGDIEQRKHNRFQTGFNPSSYMFALEKFIVDAGVKLFYDTRLCAVRREGERMSHVIVENKSGRFALECGVAIDATGDADLCFLAGERTEALDSNVPAGWFYTLRSGELKIHEFSDNYNARGLKTAAGSHFFRGDNGEDVTAHLLKSRERIRETLAKLRAKHPNDDVQLLMPPSIPCARMTRRLAGGFALAAEHVHQWLDDAIGLTGDWRKAGPVYAIPFRALCGVKTNNLLAAGRCICVDNSVWDVTRAIPGCVVTGQAAGVAAALSVASTNSSVHALDCHVLQSRLKEEGVLLDRKLLTPVGDSK